jgi:hypothetical protein
LSSKLYGESQKEGHTAGHPGDKAKFTSKITSAKGLGHGSSGRVLPRSHYWTLHWEVMPNAYFFSKEWEDVSSTPNGFYCCVAAPNHQHNSKNQWGYTN